MLVPLFRDLLFGVRDSLRGFLVVHKLDQPPKQRKTVDDEKSPKKAADSTRTLSVLEARRIERARAEERESPTKRKQSEVLGRKPQAWKRVLQCVGLNVLCIVVLQLIVLPLIRGLSRFFCSVFFSDRWNPAETVWLSDLLGALSVLPVFLVSRVINALWFADIAGASLKHRGLEPMIPASFSRSVADFVLAIVLETLFLLQSMAMAYLPIPYIAPLLSYVHLSLLYALYSFEYSWMSHGYELKTRIRRIEAFWPYYLGFGAPLTLLTSISTNFVVNGCLFGMAFPFFIISSYQVLPDKPPFGAAKTSSELVPVLHIFAPSLTLTNKISMYLASVAHGAR
uniref:Etoposide-induced protein 2.4 n=1 Tax=Plectus sambesii TaxID=2011161 RepID=A0A914XLV7_9BILA